MATQSKGTIISNDSQYMSLANQVNQLNNQVSSIQKRISGFTNSIDSLKANIAKQTPIYESAQRAAAAAVDKVIAATPLLANQAAALSTNPDCCAATSAVLAAKNSLDSYNNQLKFTTEMLNRENTRLATIQTQLVTANANLNARYNALFSN